MSVDLLILKQQVAMGSASQADILAALLEYERTVKDYLDVADALLPRSNGPLGLVCEALRLRRAEHDLQAHVQQLQAELDEARASVGTCPKCNAPLEDPGPYAAPEFRRQLALEKHTCAGPAPGWQGDVWAGIAEKQLKELERLRPIRDAALLFNEATREFRRLVDSDALLSGSVPGSSFERAAARVESTDKKLRALLDAEEKIVGEERAARRDPS